VERKLTTILAADVVGYSALMERDEAGTHERLSAGRKELFEPEIARHHGRVFKLMGDGLLAEFGSVVDAVECAVSLQRGLTERNANVAEDQRIEVRVGINLGEVIVEGDGNRPVTTGDLNITLLPESRLSIINNFSISNTRMNGSNFYEQFDNATLSAQTVHFQFLGVRMIANATDIRYRVSKMFDVFQFDVFVRNASRFLCSGDGETWRREEWQKVRRRTSIYAA